MRTRHGGTLIALVTLTAGLLFIGTGSMAGRVGGGTRNAAAPQSRTDTISVPQMQCSMCEDRIAGAVEKMRGIRKVSADAQAKHVVVTYDPRKISLVEIEKKIAAVGYDAGEMKALIRAQESLPSCCRPGGHS